MYLSFDDDHGHCFRKLMGTYGWKLETNSDLLPYADFVAL